MSKSKIAWGILCVAIFSAVFLISYKITYGLLSSLVFPLRFEDDLESIINSSIYSFFVSIIFWWITTGIYKKYANNPINKYIERIFFLFFTYCVINIINQWIVEGILKWIKGSNLLDKIYLTNSISLFLSVIFSWISTFLFFEKEKWIRKIDWCFWIALMFLWVSLCLLCLPEFQIFYIRPTLLINTLFFVFAYIFYKKSKECCVWTGTMLLGLELIYWYS